MDGGNFVNQSINHFPQITQQTYKREVELESPVHVLKIRNCCCDLVYHSEFFPIKNKIKFRFLWLYDSNFIEHHSKESYSFSLIVHLFAFLSPPSLCSKNIFGGLHFLAILFSCSLCNKISNLCKMTWLERIKVCVFSPSPLPLLPPSLSFIYICFLKSISCIVHIPENRVNIYLL